MPGVSDLFEWMRGHEPLLWWLGLLSIVTFAGSLIVIPVLIARLPADYFTAEGRRRRQAQRQHPVLRIAGLLAKNLFGVIFVLAGIAMLVLPGQGILTMIVGLSLMNFPGKPGLERRILTARRLRRAVNWIRAKAHRPPLRFDREP